ncbi:MAG: helix-turn-helix transcriptional regulator [Clostridiales bacterium]|nr:helix-turn-helix transcriptional regulator [Clostridiales bacterium]
MAMEYGSALKRQRLATGKSLVEVANETGISYQNLSRWERNEVLPNIDFCVKLAKYYDITIEELFGITDM